jgi:hypothetical protein
MLDRVLNNAGKRDPTNVPSRGSARYTSTQSCLPSQTRFLLIRPGEKSMLKIAFSETPAEERWILHGQLTHPWVQEFRASLKKNHRADLQRARIVDLNDVTFVDKSGERLLRLLAKNGARFSASGVYTKHILEQLTARRKHGRTHRGKVNR